MKPLFQFRKKHIPLWNNVYNIFQIGKTKSLLGVDYSSWAHIQHVSCLQHNEQIIPIFYVLSVTSQNKYKTHDEINL